MQRHAVHGRHHAVLAHAVVDIAAGTVARRRCPACALVLVLFEWVRSAEPPTISGTAAVRTSSASWLDLRVAQLGLSRPAAACSFGHARRDSAGSSPGMRPLELGALGARRASRGASQAARTTRRVRRPPPRGANRLGHLERADRPAQRLAWRPRSRRRRAARRDWRTCRPWSARRSRSSCGRRSSSAGRSLRARASAASIASGRGRRPRALPSRRP